MHGGGGGIVATKGTHNFRGISLLRNSLVQAPFVKLLAGCCPQEPIVENESVHSSNIQSLKITTYMVVIVSLQHAFLIMTTTTHNT